MVLLQRFDRGNLSGELGLQKAKILDNSMHAMPAFSTWSDDHKEVSIMQNMLHAIFADSYCQKAPAVRKRCKYYTLLSEGKWYREGKPTMFCFPANCHQILFSVSIKYGPKD